MLLHQQEANKALKKIINYLENLQVLSHIINKLTIIEPYDVSITFNLVIQLEALCCVSVNCELENK